MNAKSKYIQESSNPLRNVAHFLKRNMIQKLNEVGDTRLGIDAGGQIETDELDSTGPNAANSYVYLGTPYTALDIIFRSLKIEHEKFDFVDFGSGKGRVLCKAAEFPFNQIYGIELSTHLHEKAHENVTKTNARFSDRIKLINEDVTKFIIPDTPLVFFNFNSFNEKVLGEVIFNIEKSIRNNKRDCYFVYINPKNEKLILANSNFEKLAMGKFHDALVRFLSPWPIAIYQMK